MGQRIEFLNMFSQYQPSEALKSALNQTAVVAADIDPETRRITAAIYADTYIPRRILDQVQQELCACYGLRSVELTATHPADQLSAIEPDELMGMFVNLNSMTRGSLAGASWRWEGETLHIDLQANGKATLEECVPQIKNALRERFAADVEIIIHAGELLEGQELFDAMEKMRSSMISQLPKPEFAPKKEQPQGNGAIFGRPFKGTPVAMNELSLDMGTIVVEGRVFSKKDEHKDLTKRNAKVINFDITDNLGAVRVSRFLENKEADPILEKVGEGTVIRVQGRLQVDNFTNEIVLKPNAIMLGSLPKRQDTVEGEKRVELHLHTRMSMMDALTNTDAAIKQAAAWGHKAIAITDHGCVQSFTDALHTVEAWGGGPKVVGTDEVIKILYGCEGYYINDVDDRLAVHGSQNMTFDEEYVAFDLETTGLYRQDTIIEIGAVRMKNGQEIDRFQTFVDPHRRLHPKTVELTGITDDMLVGAPELKDAMADFRAFVGDSVLVAHNADFDVNFVRRACTDLGINWEMTSVDTLTISQNLLPQLHRMSLDVWQSILNWMISTTIGQVTMPLFAAELQADYSRCCRRWALKTFSP